MIKASTLPRIFLALLLAGTSAALADSVTLKTGEVLEGQVLKETPAEVVIDVKVGGGITDQRTLAKTEVSAVSKTTPDALAFEKIKTYKVGPNSLAPAKYKAILAALQDFQKRFPASAQDPQVKAALEAFSAEKARVDAKDFKWNNRWYTPEQFEQQKYQLRGQILLAAMRDQAARAETITALNTFDRLEREYPGSEAYVDAVESAFTLVRRLEGEVNRAVDLANSQLAQFNSKIQLVSEPDKSRTIELRKNQIAAAEAAVAASQAKWKPLLPISEKSPQALKGTIATEVQRLSQLPVSSMKSSIAAVTAAYAALDAKNVTEAETQARNAQSLWSQNESLTRLTPAIEALKEAIKSTPTPSPSPSPTASPAKATTSPAPAPKK